MTNCQSVGNIHDTCQDHTYFRQNGDLVVAALADGLSSNNLSDLGAKFFTEAACEEICNNFDEYYNNTLSSRDFVECLQKSIGDKYNDTQIQEMKCTLLFCAISENRYLLGHIGDGAILCFGKKVGLFLGRKKMKLVELPLTQFLIITHLNILCL